MRSEACGLCFGPSWCVVQGGFLCLPESVVGFDWRALMVGPLLWLEGCIVLRQTLRTTDWGRHDEFEYADG